MRTHWFRAVIKRQDCRLTGGWPPATRGSAPPPPSLKCTSCPQRPQWEPFLRTQASDGDVVLRPPGLSMVSWHQLNHVKSPLETFKILVGRFGDLLILWLPKKSLICKSPCLLNCHLPIWSGLFLRSLPADRVWGQFANQHHYHLSQSRIKYSMSTKISLDPYYIKLPGSLRSALCFKGRLASIRKRS